MKGPHVLILPSWYPSSAYPMNGVFFREQAEILQGASFPVGVIFPELRRLRAVSLDALWENHFQITARREGGIPTVRFHGWNLPSARLRRKAFCRGARLLARRYVERYGVPDLIHAHSALWAGVAGVDIAEEWNLKFVLTEHQSGFIRNQIQDWQIPWIARCLENADRVTAVSAHLRSAMEPYAGDTDIHVTPNVVDTDFFDLADRTGRDGFTFLTISFLNDNKAVDVLIKAFAQAFGSSEEVRLVVGGDGPVRSTLEELARRCDVSSQVDFLGMLSRIQVREAMGKADVFVLPSRRETFGVVLIEAMATGLPVLATRCGGPEEIVDRETGILVEPGEVQELTEALHQIRHAVSWYDPEVIRRRTIDQYGKHAFLRRLSAHYADVIATGGTSEGGNAA